MKSLQKFLVVFIVIATGLGAAMLFRKQEADGEAGNASGASAATVENVSSASELPQQGPRQTVPLPSDVAAAGRGTTNTNPPPPASDDSGGPAPPPLDEAIPPVRPTIRTPPVLPPSFPQFRPREIAAGATNPADSTEPPSAPVPESLTQAPPRMLPDESNGRLAPTVPPPTARNVTTPARSSNAVVPPPRPVEASKPAASELAPQLRTHRIVNGDTLARIARRYLGSEDRGAEVFELNRGVLTDPQMLPLGRTIKIPPREGVTDTNAARAGGTILPLPPLVPLPPGALARP